MSAYNKGGNAAGLPNTGDPYPLAPQIQARQDWEGQFPNPTALQTWNRLQDVNRVLAYWHNLAEDAPLFYYDEQTDRQTQLLARLADV